MEEFKLEEERHAHSKTMRRSLMMLASILMLISLTFEVVQGSEEKNHNRIVELTYPCIQLHSSTLASIPISTEKLRQFKLTGQYSDVNVYIENYDLVTRTHKVVLNLWSVPFTKMFTIRMSESMTPEIDSALLHLQPKSTVGTPTYIAPEIADVWSCRVTLYVILVGAYPFEDPEDPRDFKKTIGRIMSVQYSITDYVHLSSECRHLLTHIFVANPAKASIILVYKCWIL
ncbi:hypothetical protein HN51_011088 [Arachis hypogaea]